MRYVFSLKVSNQIDVLIGEAPHIESFKEDFVDTRFDKLKQKNFQNYFNFQTDVKTVYFFFTATCLSFQSKYDISTNSTNPRNPFKIIFL
jgi:hypothetical protein